MQHEQPLDIVALKLSPEAVVACARRLEEIEEELKPLTRHVDLKYTDYKQEIEDKEMGDLYLYVFDTFFEVYGVYPDKLVGSPEDRVRLGQMMNLAIKGYRFDI